jgi:hypothetical protein
MAPGETRVPPSARVALTNGQSSPNGVDRKLMIIGFLCDAGRMRAAHYDPATVFKAR